MVTKMIHRKIVKVNTTGSRATRDLRPEFSERLAHGLNYAVLEYNEAEGWCVVELWCSDHSLLKVADQKGMADLEDFSADSAVIENLTSHPASPPLLASIGFGGLNSPKVINAKNKVLEFEGRQGNFLRKKKRKRTDGKEEDFYIVDEG